MIELILCLIILAAAVPAIRVWNDRLEAAAAMDVLIPTAVDVADVEADLPEMRELFPPASEKTRLARLADREAR